MINTNLTTAPRTQTLRTANKQQSLAFGMIPEKELIALMEKHGFELVAKPEGGKWKGHLTNPEYAESIVKQSHSPATRSDIGELIDPEQKYDDLAAEGSSVDGVLGNIAKIAKKGHMYRSYWLRLKGEHIPACHDNHGVIE
jgi:hypothetical protein